jgi:hypothetical protein
MEELSFVRGYGCLIMSGLTDRSHSLLHYSKGCAWVKRLWYCTFNLLVFLSRLICARQLRRGWGQGVATLLELNTKRLSLVTSSLPSLRFPDSRNVAVIRTLEALLRNVTLAPSPAPPMTPNGSDLSHFGCIEDGDNC